MQKRGGEVGDPSFSATDHSSVARSSIALELGNNNFQILLNAVVLAASGGDLVSADGFETADPAGWSETT